MATNVGINLIEMDGLASPAIQPAPTSVAAFLGLAERGVPHQPVRVSNPRQFRERFGAHRSDGALAFAVDGFFLNGGREAYVSRVVAAASTAASVNLNDRQTVPAPTLRVTAGYRGVADPGGWGERLRIDVRDDPRGSTELQAGTAPGATSAVLLSLSGVRVGGVVRFVDGGSTFYRRVTAIDPLTRTVSWTDPVAPALNQASTQVTTAEFRIIVRFRATPTSSFAVVEDWRQLSMETDSDDYAIDRVNHDFTGSKHILLQDLSGTAPSGLENPAVVSSRQPTGGSETAPGPADYAGDAAARTGLHGLDTRQPQLLSLPDAHALSAADRVTAVRAALDYCAERGDCMFVGAAPDRGTAGGPARALNDYTQLESDYLDTVRTYAANFQANKVYGALYAPFIQVLDPSGAGAEATRFIPPDGHVMGVYARTDQERGIFKAPAGIAAQVRGALQTAATFSDAQHTDMVRNALVNGIRIATGSGITVAASRTLSSDVRWRFVNVRLLFNFVKASLRDGLRFVRQEPHSDQLRRMVRFNVVEPFLLGLWRSGAFGSGAPGEVFRVKCDAENNPPEEVDLGNFRVEVYFNPVKPAETILIVVGQKPSGATAQEA